MGWAMSKLLGNRPSVRYDFLPTDTVLPQTPAAHGPTHHLVKRCWRPCRILHAFTALASTPRPAGCSANHLSFEIIMFPSSPLRLGPSPGLLGVSVDDLERKFRALAASFGAFSSDAIDVVLADPSLVLRAGEQQQEQQQQQGQGQQQQAAGGVEARAARGAGREEARGRRGAAEGQGGKRKGQQQGRVEGRQREEGRGEHGGPQAQGNDGGVVEGQLGGGSGGGGAGSGGYPADLNTMSAADFDKLGSEGLPAPPPPSRRRRR